MIYGRSSSKSKNSPVLGKTGSWLKTPADIRKAGDALSAHRSDDRLRVSRESATFFSDSGGFRCVLRVPKVSPAPPAFTLLYSLSLFNSNNSVLIEDNDYGEQAGDFRLYFFFGFYSCSFCHPPWRIFLTTKKDSEQVGMTMGKRIFILVFLFCHPRAPKGNLWLLTR
jgi:hypothetical protein